MTDELYYDAVDLLQRLIATPSVSRKEKDAADVVEEFMRGCGYRPRRHGNNVWITGPGYDPSRPTLLLNSHIDTVKPVGRLAARPVHPHSRRRRAPLRPRQQRRRRVAREPYSRIPLSRAQTSAL